MTIVKVNSADGGTNGAAVTAGNSGGTSGDAFSVVSAGTGHTLTFSSTSPYAGAMCFDVGTDTSTNQVVLRYGDTLGLAQAGMRFFIKLPATLPNVQLNIGYLYTSTTIRAGAVCINNVGHLVVQDSAGTNLWTSPSALPTGAWVRVELWAKPGTSSTTGQIGGGYATGANLATTSFTESFTSAATVNASTGNIIRAQIGKLAGSFPSAQHFQLDSLVLTNTGAFIGGIAVGTPTADAGPDQTGVEPWSTITLPGADTDTGGTISTRAWAQTAGASVGALSGAATATATCTAPGTLAGSTLTFSYTVTDTGGPTASDTVNVTVLPVTERAVLGGVETPMQLRTT